MVQCSVAQEMRLGRGRRENRNIGCQGEGGGGILALFRRISSDETLSVDDRET